MPKGDETRARKTAGFGDRAEFYLCLARAFLAPAGEQTHQAFREHLAGDLAELGERVGYPLEATVADLRDSVERIPDSMRLLQLYSRLFLSPPVLAHINLGLYLDGSLMGSSVTAMEDAYRRHGLARSEGFRDLCDHLAVALEFLAYLHGAASQADSRERASYFVTEAVWFRDSFLRPALPRLCADLQAAVAGHGLLGTYFHLARLLQRALEHEARISS